MSQEANQESIDVDNEQAPSTSSKETAGATSGEPSNVPGQSSQSSQGSVTRGGTILVSERQRGNPLLNAIRSSSWSYATIDPDYEAGCSTAILFLSLKYHALKPNYIYERLKQVGHKYRLTVLLVLIDHMEFEAYLKELAKACILASVTLMCAWSFEEAGRIIDMYKMYEFTQDDMISGRQEGTETKSRFNSVVEALSSAKTVSKTDAVSLISLFGSLAKINTVSKEELSICPGMGPLKASKLRGVLDRPFKRDVSN